MLTLKQRNGHTVKTDLTTLGPMLAYYRNRAGLTPSGLSMQGLTLSSNTISAIEAGRQGISTRNLALRLANALGLAPHETDHFLYVAGYAPVIDWQQFCQDILTDLGLGSVYEEQSAALYAVLSAPAAKRARVPARRVPYGT